MKYCSLCNNQLGIFTRKHEHKTDDNKIDIWCHDCHIKYNKEIMEERNRGVNECLKAVEQLKLEEKFVAKVIKAINFCPFRRGVEVRGVEVGDYTSKDGIFTINILGNYYYERHDFRYTYENMMSHKRGGFESCLGKIIVNLSKENQTYDYKEIM